MLFVVAIKAKYKEDGSSAKNDSEKNEKPSRPTVSPKPSITPEPLSVSSDTEQASNLRYLLYLFINTYCQQFKNIVY